MQPTFLIGVNSVKFANCWQTNCGIQNLTWASPYVGLALSNRLFYEASGGGISYNYYYYLLFYNSVKTGGGGKTKCSKIEKFNLTTTKIKGKAITRVQ